MKNLPLVITLFVLAFWRPATGQVAINSTGAQADQSAMLDITSSNKGILIPRVNLLSSDDNQSPVLNPAVGLMVFNTGGNLAPGLYIWSGINWSALATMENLLNALTPAPVIAYGELHEYNPNGSSSPISIPTTGSYVAWGSASAGNAEGMTATGSSLVASHEGNYMVDFNATVRCNGGKVIDAALFINNVRQDDLHSRTWADGNRPYNLGFSGVAALQIGDTVSVGFTIQNNNGTIDLEIANLNIHMLD